MNNFNAVAEEFDIHSNVGDTRYGFPTLEIRSRKHGLLATLVGATEEILRMSVVSVVDHITEPRNVENYAVGVNEHPETHIKLSWELTWEVNPGDVLLLGTATDQKGAENLLTYLKESAAKQEG